MSTLFSILSVLPCTLCACDLNKKGKVSYIYNLISKFCDLVSLLYWWPTKSEDEKSAVRYVHQSSDYYDDVRELLFKFTEKLGSFYQHDGEHASSIDTPNVHRIIELVLNTVPSYGHFLLFAELPFEAFHQALKRNLSKNTTPVAHISAMKCVVLSDWFRRIASEMALIQTEDAALDNLERLARLVVPFGQYLFNDKLNDNDMQAFRAEALSHLKHHLLGPVSNFLTNHFPVSFYNRATDATYYWRPSPLKVHNSMIEFEIDDDLLSVGRKAISDFCHSPIEELVNLGTIQKHRTTKYLDHTITQQLNGVHQRVSSGDVIKVVARCGTENDLVVDSLESTQSSHFEHESFYFVVLNIHQTFQEELWAVVCRLNLENDNSHYAFHLTSDKIQVLQITDMISKVAVIHNCSKYGSYKIRRRAKHFRHSIDLL